ncbi:MAG: hypothetical protein BGO30_03950 [Bacteroidetes bacterium 41-46]|nr:MAG: hypothetical protein BGO30_03950 [Bacteroidetes bacterium 41-46]
MVSYRESEIQQACIRWFRYQYPQYAYMLIAIPNAARRTRKVVNTSAGSRVVCVGGKRAKDEGMVAGAADAILLLSRGDSGCLCIEFKTETGRQSQEQKRWQEAAIKAGNRYSVIRGIEEFIEVINEYMKPI